MGLNTAVSHQLSAVGKKQIFTAEAQSTQRKNLRFVKAVGCRLKKFQVSSVRCQVKKAVGCQ